MLQLEQFHSSTVIQKARPAVWIVRRLRCHTCNRLQIAATADLHIAANISIQVLQSVYYEICLFYILRNQRGLNFFQIGSHRPQIVTLLQIFQRIRVLSEDYMLQSQGSCFRDFLEQSLPYLLKVLRDQAVQRRITCIKAKVYMSNHLLNLREQDLVNQSLR